MTREEAINKWIIPAIKNTWNEKKCDEIIKTLEEQEPKTGHWIYNSRYSNLFDVRYSCSCCGRVIIVPYEAKSEIYKNYPYCHCGARMDEEEK